MDKLTLESLRVLLKSNRSYRRFDGVEGYFRIDIA